MIANLLACAAVLAAPIVTAPTASIEKVKLGHVYVADDTDNYSFKGKMEGGPAIEFSGSLSLKVIKPAEDGTAEAEWSVPTLSVLMDGSPMPGMEGIDPLKGTVDAHGMPATLTVMGADFIYTIFAGCHFLPNAEVETGIDYTVDWADKNKSSTLKGNGKLLEVKEQDGKKIAVVESKVSLLPEGQQTPGEMEIKSEFWLDSGRMIKSEGKVTIEDGTITFTFGPKS